MIERKRSPRSSESASAPAASAGQDASAAQDDLALFREAVRDAIPISGEARITLGPGNAPPVPVQAMLDDYDALDELREAEVTPESALDTGVEPSFIRDTHSPLLLRKLRRGHWVPERELDLHGATREEARLLLAEFLKDCVRRRVRCVRVIHGKGLGSKNREPVLKAKVKIWLAHRDEVLAFCQPPATMGGGGALLVLLKT